MNIYNRFKFNSIAKYDFVDSVSLNKIVSMLPNKLYTTYSQHYSLI